MSALSYLCDYGSNSEDSDSDIDKKVLDRPKLPVPNLSKVPVVPLEIHKDDPQLHTGRSRSFPHVRGNWATFVYVNYLEVDAISELINKLEGIIVKYFESCHRCDDLHISLSKTFILKYHLISPFSAALLKTISKVERFDLGFAAIKVYCNEDYSRTFISLEVDPFTQKYLSDVSRKVDDVLTEYQLPTFYENPSFHMSILWVKGNKKSEVNGILEALNEILFQEIDKSLKSVLIDTINCRSGNKYFQYSMC